MALSSASRVRRTDTDFVCAEVDGELVFMNLDGGEFYGLRGSGLRAWKLIDESGAWTPLSALLGSLCAVFEVDAETCLDDIAAFLDDLNTQGLVEVAP